MARGVIKLFEGKVERPCAVPECPDKWTIYYSSTRKAERREEIRHEEEKRAREQKNFCLKHLNISRVPSPSNRHISQTYVVVMRPKPGMFGPNAPQQKTLVPADDPVNGKAVHDTIGPGSTWYLYESELPLNARVTFSIDVDIPEEIEPTVDLEEM